ncbi:MAG TPA: hypothetical protein VMW64_10375 [Dehalococcoidia bacterium]|nr:hypothetical protein [Dehalococcoidia bacterium]
MAAERAGVPAVVNTCQEFVTQAHEVNKLGGLPWEPVVMYPGHIDTYSLEQRLTYISELVAPGNEEALTTPIEAAAAVAEPPETTIAFKGTFEEVLDFYREKMCSDGLPIIPPTVEKVGEFLKYTDYPPDAILGRAMPPSYREATPWAVAVNGVMAGCRPEYMPVLIGLAKCFADPKFTVQDSSSTPGWETLSILNGPIIKQLGFNYECGVMTAGYQANTSVGRFWKLFQRNLLEIRVEKTDKGSFGRNWLTVLAENDDFCREIGWNPLSVQRGFEAGDNVVTTMSFMGRIYDPNTKGDTAEFHLAELGSHYIKSIMSAPSPMTSPTKSILIAHTPIIAGVLAKSGYSKEDVRRYFAEVKITAAEFDAQTALRGGETGTDPSAAPLASLCEIGTLDKELFCATTDPNRMVPLVNSEEEILIVVTGDPGRNRNMIIVDNQYQGPATSMKIELPKNWDALYDDSQLKKDLEKSGQKFL